MPLFTRVTSAFNAVVTVMKLVELPSVLATRAENRNRGNRVDTGRSATIACSINRRSLASPDLRSTQSICRRDGGRRTLWALYALASDWDTHHCAEKAVARALGLPLQRQRWGVKFIIEASKRLPPP